MQTLVYARYSSQLQNPRSIADQLASCRKRAAAEGWTIVAEFSDAAISGAAGIDEAQRPGLAALLDRLDKGDVDQVLTESTDRIARHQGDAFAVRERIEHAGARLFTLMDGVVDDITGTIKGLMDARTRKDLAQRVRRGHVGNIAQGRSANAVAYGYRRVTDQLDAKGNQVKGLRAIDPETSAIVLRIFREYAAGRSPRQIARGLNDDGIPAPRGGTWRAASIIGHRGDGFGILANPVYIGQLVYGRTKTVVDPRTRQRTFRRTEGPIATGEAPHLRIVSDELWAAAQAEMQARAFGPAHRQRRPKRLLSGLGVCGCCGKNWIVTRANSPKSKIRESYYGCSGVVDGSACPNRRLIGEAEYERRVLAQLTEQMLAPEVVEAYLAEYRAEAARRAGEAGRERAALERKQAEANRKVANLVAAIAEGGDSFPEIRAALAAAKAQAADAAKQLASLDALPAIALHPGLARQYRAAIANLAAELADEVTRREAAPKLRALIAKLVVTPAANASRGVTVEVHRHLDEILALAATPARRQA